MKFRVNDNCIGCGLCPSICPEVFHLTDAGVAEAADGEVSQESKAAAEEAQSSCPTSAIESD